MIFALIIIAFSSLYVWAMTALIRNWGSIEIAGTSEKYQKVSVVVVYRNEKDHLEALFKSLVDQQYLKTHFEIILINDHSTDNSLALLQDLITKTDVDVRLLSLPENQIGKKNGIEYGVQQAQYDLILMTDADCIVKTEWINSMQKHSNSDFVSGPVSYISQNGLWSNLVALDFLSLIALGGALIQRKTPVLANGANMMFQKQKFVDLGGYSGNKNIASGDDVFLLEKFATHQAEKIVFNKDQNALVETQMPSSLASFIHQRIRWSKKTRYSKKAISNPIVLSLTGFYFVLMSSLLLAMIQQELLLSVVVGSMILLKVIMDIIFFKKVLVFNNKMYLLPYVLIIEIIHPFYITIIAVLSMFKPFVWKGRRISNG
jgi:poly-beta-1,6-N-acetyl-D-glucosamine synthase